MSLHATRPDSADLVRGPCLGPLRFKIASTDAEFEAVHRLNHATFAIEIPQHPPSADGLLIDRYHEANTYAVCLDGETVVGMIAGRCERPFSLDQKVSDLDSHLPAHHKAVEVRLLAVAPDYRHSRVFVGLVKQIISHFLEHGCDLAVISGTVRQLKLYRHLGFRAFGAPVGTAEALYQPMFLTLGTLQRTAALCPSALAKRAIANFLPGPVSMKPEVLAAYAAPPISHRDAAFAAQLQGVRDRLARLTGAARAAVLLGSGTLGNDVVAAQLSCLDGPGLVLSNGEFGERLIDHARRWRLPFTALSSDWGRPHDWTRLQTELERARPRWVWGVLCETSTGLRNPIERLLPLCAAVGADLCLDAVSAVGLFPVNLARVRFATAVSGKGLAAPAGLVAVFHDGRIAPAGRLPRYLDLAAYEGAAGVPFTHSSNLVSALEASLALTAWDERFERIERSSSELRESLRALGLQVIAAEADAAPGILTIALPRTVSSAQVAATLAAEEIQIAAASAYLLQRNWVQVCLMGEFDEVALRRVPRLLFRALGGGAASAVPRPDRSARAGRSRAIPAA